MTTPEIITALRRSAQVCIEKRIGDWSGLEVCRADGTYYAAGALLVEGELFIDSDPDHAAFFLLLCAEATNA